MQNQIEKIIVDLIKHELNLPDNYGTDDRGDAIPSVIIRTQNVKLFNTPKLQITVATLTNRIFSNRTYTREIIEKDENNQDVSKYIEETYLNEARTMQIDVYSRNNDAWLRYPEVQACLSSTYAEQLQGKYQFKIGKISNATNTSGLDGGSDINRYTIRFDVLCWFKKSKEVDYYDTFGLQARNTNTNIFADFTIE